MYVDLYYTDYTSGIQVYALLVSVLWFIKHGWDDYSPILQACSSPGMRPVATVIKMDVLELKGDLLDGKKLGYFLDSKLHGCRHFFLFVGFHSILSTRWWFQTFFIFTPIWGRFPFWLVFLRWVETTNQSTFFIGKLGVWMRSAPCNSLESCEGATGRFGVLHKCFLMGVGMTSHRFTSSTSYIYIYDLWLSRKWDDWVNKDVVQSDIFPLLPFQYCKFINASLISPKWIWWSACYLYYYRDILNLRVGSIL